VVRGCEYGGPERGSAGRGPRDERKKIKIEIEIRKKKRGTNQGLALMFLSRI
jgi:hypothetical protein